MTEGMEVIIIVPTPDSGEYRTHPLWVSPILTRMARLATIDGCQSITTRRMEGIQDERSLAVVCWSVVCWSVH